VAYKNNQEIEKAARELQIKYWRFLINQPDYQLNPFDVTNPEALAQFIGTQYQEHARIPEYFEDNSVSELGGVYDPEQNIIAVSTNFSREMMAFTAAHELGHCVLGHNGRMHRDIPLNGPTQGLPTEELDANYFAACILMPRGLLLKEFDKRFFGHPMNFDEHTGFHLGLDYSENLLRPADYEREIAITSAVQFGQGHHFNSLRSVFGVSLKAMAYRLRELGVARYP